MKEQARRQGWWWAGIAGLVVGLAVVLIGRLPVGSLGQWIVFAGFFFVWWRVALFIPALLFGAKRLCEGPVLNAVEALAVRAGSPPPRVYQIPKARSLLPLVSATGLSSNRWFFFLPEALTERLSQDEIQFIAAHELGHLKQRDWLWYLGLLVGLILIIQWSMAWLVRALPDGIYFDENFWLVVLLGLAAIPPLILLVGLALSALSRYLVKRADRFAFRVTGSNLELAERALTKLEEARRELGLKAGPRFLRFIPPPEARLTSLQG